MDIEKKDQKKQQQVFKVQGAQWGSEIEIKEESGAKVLQDKFLPLLNNLLEFLRNGKHVVIKNKDVSDVQQEIYQVKTYSQKEFLEFFSQNVKGFVEEQCKEQLDLSNLQEYSEKIVEKWLKIKKFLYWSGFFFKSCVIFANDYLLYEGVFKDYVKNMFFEQYKEGIYTCIEELTSIERESQTEINHNLQILVEIYLICGFEKLIVKKLLGQQSDPLIYREFQEDQLKTNEFYVQNLEKQYMNNLGNIYQNYREKWLIDNHTSQYVDHALKILEIEDIILDRYFPLSKRLILNFIEDIIIVNISKDLGENVNTGFKKMLINQKYQEISNIYKLFKRVNVDHVKEQEKQTIPMQHLGDIFKNYIIEQGQKFNEDQDINKKSVQYYQKVMNFKEEMDKIANIYMEKNEIINEAKDKGFTYFLNKFKESGNFLAQFCDYFMHKDSGKQFTEDQVENYIEKVNNCVYYLQQKDVFFSQYERYLSNRLLGNKVSNTDNENKLISTFKRDHSAQSMKNCSSMMSDISGVDNTNKEYKQYLEVQQDLQKGYFEGFSVTVLQKAFWPLNLKDNNNSIRIPEGLKSNLENFEQYFLKSNQNKKIEWLMQEGEGLIQMQFGNKASIVCNTIQMMFLLAFNEQNQWQLKQIKEYLGIQGSKAAQISVQLMKLRLIKVEPQLKKNEKIGPESKLILQENFKSDKRRLCLNVQRKVEDREVEKVEDQEIKMNRGYILEAVIVKIMKGRKTMGYQDLQGEIIKMVKLFRPEIKMIKMKIEDLIERDYLARDQNNTSVLNYQP